MKKLVNLLCTTILFVALFYQQEALGFNLTLFCLLLLCFVLFNRTGKSKLNQWLVLAVITSALSFAWYADLLSFVALLFSLLAVSYASKYRGIQSVLYPVFAVVNSVSFIVNVFIFSNWIPERLYKNFAARRSLMLFVLPIVVAVIFLSIYIGTSDIMAEYVKHFVQELDPFQLIVLSAAGFVMMFCFWFKYLPKPLLLFNQRLTKSFSPDVVLKLKESEVKIERQSAFTALVLINGLLLIFLVIYNYEQFFRVVKITELSNDTHQRVGAVIFSIILAIAVVLFYFRRDLNFDPHIRLTKRLVYLWIGLNTLLVLSAFLKNGQYMMFYGLTFKRITVFIFLILCWLGLWFTFLKIKNRKTNFYLIQNMAKIGFIVLIVSAPINFSWIVTKCNLRLTTKPDIEYLQQLDYNKGILSRQFKNNPEWEGYLKSQKNLRDTNLKQTFLSRRFYDYFY